MFTRHTCNASVCSMNMSFTKNASSTTSVAAGGLSPTSRARDMHLVDIGICVFILSSTFCDYREQQLPCYSLVACCSWLLTVLLQRHRSKGIYSTHKHFQQVYVHSLGGPLQVCASCRQVGGVGTPCSSILLSQPFQTASDWAEVLLYML